MLHIYLFSLKLKSHSCIKHICALDSLYTNLYSAQAARQAQTATSNNNQVWQIVIFGNLWLRNENFPGILGVLGEDSKLLINVLQIMVGKCCT